MPNKSKNTSGIAKNIVGSQAEATVLDSTTKLDIDTNKILLDNIIEAGLSGGLNVGELDKFTQISFSRDQMYQLIDTMSQDSSVSSIIRTYAEDVCEPADSGHIVWAESSNPNISKFVNYLLDIMNVDKNIFSWAYSLIKYGDVYLRLYRDSDYKDTLFKSNNIDKVNSAKNVLNEELRKQIEESVNMNIHNTNDNYSYYIEMIPDPGSMFELTRYGKTYGFIETPNIEMGVGYIDNYLDSNGTATNNYRMKSGDVNIYQADDFVHACLEDNNTRFPEKIDIFLTDSDYKAGINSTSYIVKRGKSLLYDSYKIWREKSLLENAALLNRITKSSLVRTVQVEVGDMPKEQVKLTLRRIKEMMEQKSAINTDKSMAEYANAGPVENNIYLATHEGKGTVSIGQVGGEVEVKNLADLDWWNNKFYSSYGIPKQYFGWCLRGDTEILLLDGSKYTIEELYNNKEHFIGKGIMGCNQDGSLCPTKIANIMLTNPKATYMRIWLDNNQYVDVTPDHKMMLRDGTFIEANKLTVGDSLMSYYDKIKDGRRYVLDNKLGKYIPEYNRTHNNSKAETFLKFTSLEPKLTILDNYVPEVNHKVVKLEYMNEEVPVYDITVADNCHTFALACGIFVHNCDDGAGFNGGQSLSIISSVYAKGVKRVQNALCQALSDAINLIFINKGYKSYLNNFTIKMRAPITQEETDYRNSLTNKINAISNMQGLFNDIEDKVRRLEILKTLISSLNYGDEILSEIQKEIDATKEANKKAKEEEAAAAKVGEMPPEASTKKPEMPNIEDIDLGNTSITNTSPEAMTAPKSNESEANESLEDELEKELLNESEILANEDLPTPESLNKNIDFSKNN